MQAGSLRLRPAAQWWLAALVLAAILFVPLPDTFPALLQHSVAGLVFFITGLLTVFLAVHLLIHSKRCWSSFRWRYPSACPGFGRPIFWCVAAPCWPPCCRLRWRLQGDCWGWKKPPCCCLS